MTGCASTPPHSVEPEVQLVFPPPPAQPKYIYERSLFGSKDLNGKAKESSFLSLLAGKRSEQEQSGEGMARPQALAVHHGRVFIANSMDLPISVFDIPRQRFYKIGEEGTGVLQMPSGLSVDRVGNLFVADSTAKAILVFDPEGKYLRSIGGPTWFLLDE